MKNVGKSSIIKMVVFIVIAVALFLVPVTGIGTTNFYRILINIAIYIALAQMWNLMAGYAGMLSLGNQLFVGIGGYCVAMVTTKFGLPFFLGFILGGLISAVLAVALSAILLKMRGMYFAISTWLIAEMVRIAFTQWEFVGKNAGIAMKNRIDPALMYVMSIALAIVCILAVYLLMRSKTGLGLIAMRNDIDASSGVGVSIFKTRMICYVIAGFFTGVAGAMYYLYMPFINPDGGFTNSWTIALVVAVIIGGVGTIGGPILGAIIYILLTNLLADFAGYSNMILGAIAIIVVLFLPNGLLGTLQKKLKFELFSSRRYSKNAEQLRAFAKAQGKE